MKRVLIAMGITDKSSLFSIIKQFLKFSIVGISNTLIALGTYYLLIYIGVHYIPANIVGFIISVCNAYFWNSRYVFKTKGSGEVKTFAKMVTVYGSTSLVGTGFLFIMVDLIGISQWIAPLINICIMIPMNFLLNKFWAFKKKQA
jgi:putative flippase GtrA